jgi:hypothetical protein
MTSLPRRRFQFRLTLVMLLMTLACIAASWIGWRLYKDRLDAEVHEVNMREWAAHRLQHRYSIDNVLVGKTEREIIALNGQPDSDHLERGVVFGGNWELDWRPIPVEPFRILTYEAANSGNLWIWLKWDWTKELGSHWICFKSGVRFSASTKEYN